MLEGLDNDVFNLGEDCVIGNFVLFHVLFEESEGSFGVGLILSLWLLLTVGEVLVVLVYGVVGQMDEWIPEDFLVVGVFFCGKPDQALLVDVDS